MADSVMPNPGEVPSGGPNRDRKPAFSVRQAQRKLREAERTLARYEKQKIRGTQLDAAKKAVREAKRALDDMTSGPRRERREARQEFMEDYYNKLGGPWIAELVKRDPELRRLFEKAIRTDDMPGFMDDLYQSDWWNDSKKSGTWKNAFRLEFAKDKTAWNDALDDAKEAIRKAAKSIYNMVVPDDVLDQIARRYVYQGWGEEGDEGLQTWLARQLRRQQKGDTEWTPGGQVLDYERTLLDGLRQYGLTRDDANSWASSTAAKILDPKANFNEDDAWNELIAEAESLYPVFAGRLSKERSVRDLASGYIGQMARLLELNDPELVDLTDPLLQRAFTGLDEKNQPRLMPLWEFNQAVKKDERWQYTNNALNTYSSIGSDLARMMGFVG